MLSKPVVNQGSYCLPTHSLFSWAGSLASATKTGSQKLPLALRAF